MISKKQSKKIIFLFAILMTSVFVCKDAGAAGLQVGNTTLNLVAGENLYYGVTSPTNSAGNFLLFEKGAGNVIFRIDNAGNITSNGSLVGSNSYWNLSGSNLFASSTAWNLGIGTTTPGSYKLYVNGTTYLNGASTINGVATVNSGLELATGGTRSVSYYGPVANGYFTQMQTTGTAGYGTYGPVSSDWALYNRFSGANTRGWIWQLGTVNIAGLNGQGNLQIAGNFNSQGSGSNYFAGNVGVGTTTPAAKLDVVGAGQFTLPVTVATPTTGPHAATKSYVDSTAASIAASAAGGGVGTGTSGQTLRHNGTSWIANSALYNNGTNVGVGTASPNAKLQVNGTFSLGTGNALMLEENRRSKNSSNVDIETRYGFVSNSNNYLEIRGFAPPTMYRTTSDRPAPYGIGFGNGSESGGIMPVGQGDNLQEIMFYGANSGPTTFTWKRQIWEGTTMDASGSNYYSSPAMSLNANSGLLYVAGNIGIGSASPAYALDVPAAARFSSPLIVGTPTAANHAVTRSYLESSIGNPVSSGTTGQTLRHNGTSWIANSLLYNNGTNVGIGTTAPGYPLQISATSGDTRNIGMFLNDAAVYNLASANTANRVASGIRFNWYSENWQIGAARGGGVDIGGLVFSRNGLEKLVIDSGGNVGIGSTIPAAKLDVTGGGRFTNPVVVGTPTDTSHAATKSYVDGAVSSVNANLLDNIDSPRFVFGSNGSGSNGASATQNVYEMAQYKSGFWDTNASPWAPTTDWYWGATFAHQSNSASYNYSGQLAFRNGGGGNTVYARTINGGTPTVWSRLLSDTSNVNSSGNLLISGTGAHYISAGNFGVGSTVPAAKLDVAGGGQFTLPVTVATPTIGSHATTKSYVDGLVPDAGTSGQTLRNDGTRWRASSILFNNGTNIGIGTITPSALLDISGKVKITSGGIIYNTNSSRWLDMTGTLGESLKISGNITSTGGHILTNDSTFINWRFTMLENFSPQYIILCRNIGGNDVNGQIRIDRTSSHHQASSLDVIVTSNSSAIVGGSLVTNQYTEQDEKYKLVTITYGGLSYVAIKYEGWTYPATVGHFSGRLVNTGSNSFVVIDASQVSNEINLTTTNSKNTITGSFGIGTTTPGAYKLYVNGSSYINGSLTFPAGANIVMDSNNSQLTVNKLQVNTIDPLYNIKGVNYSTFAASIVGGVKEEISGKIEISKKVADEYQAIIDFDKEKIGSDLWVWRSVIDFSEDNVEAIITPYGSFAKTYYSIDNNKFIFHSDIPVKVSYRLLAKRFDWKQWPTKAKNQKEKAGFILK